MVIMYAANACAMNRIPTLCQPAVKTIPLFARAATVTPNRSFATSTARVVPTWQQTPAAQQATTGAQPFAAKMNQGSLATKQDSRQSGGYGGESFYERYKKYGLLAAIWPFALSKEDLSRREVDAFNRLNQEQCKYYVDQIWPRNEEFLQGPDREIELRVMKVQSPKCIQPFVDYYSAQLAVLQAEIKDSKQPQPLEEQMKELTRLRDVLKTGKSERTSFYEKDAKIAPFVIKENQAREALERRDSRLPDLGWHKAQKVLPNLNSEDAKLYNDYLAAQKAYLEEDSRQVVDGWDPDRAKSQILGNRIRIKNIKEYEDLLNK